jgi:hypothetical protein
VAVQRGTSPFVQQFIGPINLADIVEKRTQTDLFQARFAPTKSLGGPYCVIGDSHTVAHCSIASIDGRNKGGHGIP